MSDEPLSSRKVSNNRGPLLPLIHSSRKRRAWYSAVENNFHDSRPNITNDPAVIDRMDAHFTSRHTSHEQAQPTSSASPHSSPTAVLSSMISLGDIATTLELLEPPGAPYTPPHEQHSFDQRSIRFRPLPPNLPKADLEYIQHKRAIEIPPNILRDEIVRCYIDHVHPYMPLLDAHELLQLINPCVTEPVTTQYSLLLFQCVMFAAVAFADERLVQGAGYTDIKSARKALFLKTRVRLPRPLIRPPSS